MFCLSRTLDWILSEADKTLKDPRLFQFYSEVENMNELCSVLLNFAFFISSN
jgi:hypothetical protein